MKNVHSDKPTELTPEEASAGRKTNFMLRILVISTIGSVLVVIAVFSGFAATPT